MRRDEIFAIGYPAEEAYGPFINLLLEHATPGDTILDLGGGEGAYSCELNRRGFRCTNVDFNKNYLLKSRARGVESCAMDARFLGFKDKSFDIVLLFEVIEHIPHCDDVLEEAFRVAKKHILITVPNCSGCEKLREQRVTYDHLLATDHVKFFSKEDLERLLSNHFDKFQVMEAEPVAIVADPELIFSPWLRIPICFLRMLRLTGPKVRFGLGVNYRLHGIVDIV